MVHFIALILGQKLLQAVIRYDICFDVNRSIGGATTYTQYSLGFWTQVNTSPTGFTSTTTPYYELVRVTMNAR